MEIFNSRPDISAVKKTVGRVGTRVLLAGMSIGGGASIAHQLANPLDVEAADCRGAIRLTVREFKDVAGVKNQYDSVIDIALNPIPDTIVKFSTDGAPVEPVAGIKADKDGRLSTDTFSAPCNSIDGKKIEVLAEGTTPDGRKVSDVLFVQDGRREEFKLWVAKKESQPITPSVTESKPQSPQQDDNKKRMEELQAQLEESKKKIEELEKAQKDPQPGQGLSLPSLPANLPVAETAGGLAALAVALGLILDRTRTWLQGIRVNRPRTRIGNTIYWPYRELRYRLGPLRTYNQGIANGTIAAGTPPPARGYPGPWGV
jgi:hypothetical protein